MGARPGSSLRQKFHTYFPELLEKAGRIRDTFLIETGETSQPTATHPTINLAIPRKRTPPSQIGALDGESPPEQGAPHRSPRHLRLTAVFSER